MYRKILYLMLLFCSISNGFSEDKISTIKIETETPYGVLKSEVHFTEKYLNLALRVKEIQEKDLIKLVNYFEYAPRDVVHFYIDTSNLVANGNATIFPVNLINLYVYPPKGQEHLTIFSDWFRSLVVHEFTHIIHLDQTRGFVEDGRKIFGTIAKVIPGITPRWFTEGIATYFESTVLTRGRLQNEILDFELKQFLMNPKNCKTLDCIDEPGVKPHGQLAYWIGAKFMKFIEEKKPKTIKCLVEKNSQKFPFFIPDVFLDCYQEELQSVYLEFIQAFSDYKLSDDSINKEISDLQLIDWQKGSIVNDNRWYFVLRADKEEQLCRFDLEEKVLFCKKPQVKLAHLIQVIPSLNTELEDNDSEDKLLIAIHSDPYFKNQNMTFQYFGADSLTFEENLSNFDDAFWLQKIDSKLWVKVVRDEGQEKIQIGEMEENKIRVDQELNLPDQFVFKKIVVEPTFWAIEVFDIKNENFALVLRDGDGFKIGEFKKDDNRLTFFNSDKIELNSGGEIKLKKAEEQISLINLNAINFKPFDSKTNSLSAEILDYPRLDHYKPQYWFISFGNGDNVGALGAMSSISDPIKQNSLEGSIVSYDSKKLGGDLLGSSEWDDLEFKLKMNKFYYKRDVNDINLNSESNINFNISRDFYEERFKWTPTFIIQKNWQTDFISSRSSQSVIGLSQLTFLNNGFLNLINSWNFIIKAGLTRSHRGNNFADLTLKSDLVMNLFEENQIKINTTFGKLDKSGFSDGVIFGGGTNQMNTYRWYEFYGLAYGNAYGNEMFNFRLTNDYNLMNVYRGRNLWPIYLKEWHLLLGGEYLKADRIYHLNTYFYNEAIKSAFVGFKFKTNLFYYVSIDFDLIASKIFNPNHQSSQHILLNLVGDFF